MPQTPFNIALAVDSSHALETAALQALKVGGAGLYWPNPWVAQPKLLEIASDLVPPFGGQAQRLCRLGARWSVAFQSQPSLTLPAARQLMALRLKARANAETIAFSWPQFAFSTAIGAPAVSGASQAGASLVVNGLTPSTTALIAGLFFSLTIGERSYLHALSANATVDGSGNATLAIAPILRAVPASGAALNFATPVIEGFVEGQSEDWTIDMLAFVGLPSFTVTEPT
ncbi:MAG: hypothetical protein ACRDL8_00370 [Solirubrobacteraceae bacterium]